jgi:hypothetical protein
MSLFSIFFALLYLPFLWWLARRLLPGQIKLAATTSATASLARKTHKFLGFLQWLFIILVAFWLPASLVLVFSALEPGHTPGFVSIFVNLHIDLSGLPGIEAQGLGSPILNGTTELSIPSPHLLTFFIFQATSLVKGALTIYVLFQLRNILASYCNGDSFSSGNSLRLDRIGKVLVFAYCFGPFWHFFLSGSVINGISFSSEAISVTTSTSGSLLGVFVGIGLLILAGVIREAEQIRKEQRLTI